MILSPTFPERSWTGVIVFLLIATLISLYDLDKINRIYKVIVIDFCAILSIIYIGQYITAALDINQLRGTWENRIETISKDTDTKKIAENLKYLDTMQTFKRAFAQNVVKIYGDAKAINLSKLWQVLAKK